MSENQLTAFDHPINYFHLLVQIRYTHKDNYNRNSAKIFYFFKLNYIGKVVSLFCPLKSRKPLNRLLFMCPETVSGFKFFL